MSAAAAPAWAAAELADTAAVSQRLRTRGVRLDPDEVRLLTELLGRPPRWAEAVLFGILWSEHCSYKSTRHLLKRLPTQAPQVVLGPGEDAGVVSLPAPCADLVLVLGHESHNHPSQVLPVEGAATGVGGIVRDVACMGADVIGVLDPLRFGDPLSGVAVRDVVRGVVQGVADYGNALGVPNLGGDTVFDAAYDRNCLVNVCAVGLAPADGLLHSRIPDGDGPFVFVLVGKPTDESGFGGAAFASEELGDADDRGAVQLPDPFLERVLLVAGREACARIRARGVPAGFKDLGAGGIACATSELAAAGGRGAAITLEAIPTVARPLAPEVVLCAETQERFCWVVPESFAPELCDLYNREFALGTIVPGAAARVIGRATDDGRYVVATSSGSTVIDCAVAAITSGRSVERPSRRRPQANGGSAVAEPGAGDGADAATAARELPARLASFDFAAREYLFRHYDPEVQGRTWLRMGEADAAVLRVRPGDPTGVAFAVGGDPRWCAADAGLGARHAVAEAARKVAATGARPWALTDCLNFGDAEDPDVMGDVEAAIDGLAEAAAALGALAAPGHPLPYVSGNVSLYNHSGGRSIPPSPIVMCAGVVEDVSRALPIALAHPGDALVLVGGGPAAAPAPAGGHPTGVPPLDLALEATLHRFAVETAARGHAAAAHALSDAGPALAAVEMLLAGPPGAGLGLALDFTPTGLAPEAALYGGRAAILYAVAAGDAPELADAARACGLGAWVIGRVTTDAAVTIGGGTEPVRHDVASLRAAAHAPLERLWNEGLDG